MNRAFFLDRDGTINVDYGYIRRKEDLQLLDGAAQAIRLMNNNGYKVIVITNQSGIARGYFDFSAVNHLHNTLQEMLQEKGAHIDRFYVCPHHPDGIVEPYNIVCKCRKPGLLLYERAAKEFSIDIRSSYAVGDKMTDIRDLPKLGIKGTGLLAQNGAYKSLLEFTEHVLWEELSHAD